MSEVVRSLALFVVAGLAEIGGGWLVWQWLREGKALWLGVAGGVVLVLYGVIPTLQQEAAFGRVYAAYGGVFIAELSQRKHKVKAALNDAELLCLPVPLRQNWQHFRESPIFRRLASRCL